MKEATACIENGGKHFVLLDRGRGVNVSEVRSRRAAGGRDLWSELTRVRGHRPHHRPQSKVTGKNSGSTNQSKIRRMVEVKNAAQDKHVPRQAVRLRSLEDVTPLYD